jgi:hypothetical protein
MKTLSNGQWVDNVPETSIESFAKSYVDKHVSEELQKSSETILFRRIEDKFVLPKALRKPFLDLLDKNLKTDYPDGATKYNFMKSTYFDSANFDMLKHHASKATSRFKIRTREYAPNGKLHKSDFTYMEVKAKSGNVTDKFRLRVPKEDVETFKKGAPITATVKLIKANPSIGVTELVKRIADINQSMELFHLRPSCETSYNRKAYTDGAVNDTGLRITVDEDVNYKILDIMPSSVSSDLNKAGEEHNALANMVSGFNPKDHVIVEVKHQGVGYPDWLTKFLNDNKLQKTNLSKYCWSLTKHALKK